MSIPINPWPAPNMPVNIHLPHIILCSWPVSLWSLINQIQLGRRLLLHVEKRGRQFPSAPCTKGSKCQSASQNKKRRSVRQETYPRDLPGAPGQSCVENSLIAAKHSVIDIMHLSAVFTALAFMPMSCPWENDTKRGNIIWNFRSLHFSCLWELLDFLAM